MPKVTTSMPETKRWSSNWLRGVPGLLWRLARVGIRIRPFLVVREGTPSNIERLTTDPRFSFGFVGTDDIPELVRVRPGVDAAKCAERLRSGLRCYVVKDGGRIVSMTWCDLEKFDVETFHRRLGDREAYLFGAYTDPAYRGQNLAPFLRMKCYGALRAMGRDSFFRHHGIFQYRRTPLQGEAWRSRRIVASARRHFWLVFAHSYIAALHR
jgi:ribosomal protein S18 acetylase RimI-like enzyme